MLTNRWQFPSLRWVKIAHPELVRARFRCRPSLSKGRREDWGSDWLHREVVVCSPLLNPLMQGQCTAFIQSWSCRGCRSQRCGFVCLCVCVKCGRSDTANLHHICWPCCNRSAQSSEGHEEENLSRVMNMSLWCPTNVRLWLWAVICKTTLQLHSTYCWYDQCHSQGRQRIVTVQTVVIKLWEMSWASFYNKLIAMRFFATGPKHLWRTWNGPIRS